MFSSGVAGLIACIALPTGTFYPGPSGGELDKRNDQREVHLENRQHGARQGEGCRLRGSHEETMQRMKTQSHSNAEEENTAL